MGDHHKSSERKSVSTSAHGFHAMYLGKVPTHFSSSEEHTSVCVEKLLDICNMNETFIDEVFLDIKSFALIMHYVDITSKVIDTKLFDLARISYCSAGNFEDQRILAWVYRQETEEGFQLECHAVRCKTTRKTKVIVYQLYDAITKLFVEVQAALQASETFKKAHEESENVSDSPTNAAQHSMCKTVRFDDCVQRIDFEVDDDSSSSTSVGDDSVFYDNDTSNNSHRDKESEQTCRQHSPTSETEGTCRDKTSDDDKDKGADDNEQSLDELTSVDTAGEGEVAELACPCTPLLLSSGHIHRTVLEVDNPSFQEDECDFQGDKENDDHVLVFCGIPETNLEELEDSASSGFGEDEQDSTDLSCFQDIAL